MTDDDKQSLQERMGKIEVRVSTLEKFVGELRGDIKEIKDKLLGRPSWFISLLITALVAIVVALIKIRFGG